MPSSVCSHCGWRLTLAASLLASVGWVQAGTVTVLTSFPKELTGAYQKAFEAAHPGIKVEILNKNTTASIAYVRELPAGQRPDVMWASAPDAFEVLARNKLLTSAPETLKGSSSAVSRVVNLYPAAREYDHVTVAMLSILRRIRGVKPKCIVST